MAKERTFSIIKPDATRRNLTGKINAVDLLAGDPFFNADDPDLQPLAPLPEFKALKEKMKSEQDK